MADQSRESTFGRELTKFVSSHLPYTGYSILDKISELNPKYAIFHNKGAHHQENIINKSISSSAAYDEPAGGSHKVRDFHEYMYANIQPDKGKRLAEYRSMAAFSEVSDALDEICDEMINPDQLGDIITIKLKDATLESKHRESVSEEFKKYIGYFDLQRKGWEYFRQIFIDAELYFEHVIHKDYPEKGILGVVSIPPDVIDPVFSTTQNQLVKGFILKKFIYEKTDPTKVKDTVLIPLGQDQVTYVNSGIWNETKTVRLPFIENARRAYRQLSLIEDSIVIYRLVRAPEKLVFNVDVGNMAPPKAEAYLRKLMTNYWSKRTFDTDQNGTVNKYNPQSMLDSYWFARRAGSDGTTVTQLAGGANLGELTDLVYFVKKLYKALKVPTSRVNPEEAYRDGTDILREELKFAKFIIRTQQRFAVGLKTGFIVHLKLKGLWGKYNLKEHSFDFEFNVPSNFYELREQQKLQLKYETYNSFTQNPYISNTFAQKRYLGWMDSDVLANREFLRKDAEFMWEVEQIKAAGPDWRTNPQGVGAGADAMGGGPGGGMSGLGGMSGGGSSGLGGDADVPPEFGPAPGAPAGAAPEATTPAAGTPEPTT